ncbi:gastrula zinc finger protein XlCGF26.1-like [Cydia strobilella]|uniref:gastrula zinc finger protein XlCGF26.1-like n=1 Tax=Cydia strobilella TaxID=1100964 RepID=UPI003006600E
MTLVPWSMGRPLVWDATCVDTLAPSHIPGTKVDAGAAASSAENLKRRKYAALGSSYLFAAFGVETLGPWGPSARRLHKEISARLIEASGDQRGKSGVGLPCFYCKDLFDNIEALRTHQKEHKKSDMKKSLNSFSPYSLVINVDITDLKCTLCDASLNTLKDLKSHLETKHSKKFYTEYEDRVMPFKVPMDNNYICQICGLKLENLGTMERHMNGHYRNYICDECGTGFVTSYRLRMHIKTMHVEGSFQCETCNKVFSSQLKLKSHIDTVHNMVKRFKCTKCSERFTGYFKRHQHLVAIHGEAELEYKCNVCDKVYARRYMLSRHMKRDHLEERYFQCEICSNKFFARRDLESHMVKHNGARTFECTVCKKAYARKKTLTEHMRIHNNDRRFSCAVCGLAFVQKCSLKGHMKNRIE